MKWIYFFGNLKGRIGRKTFWIASILVIIMEFIVATVAAVITMEFVSNHTAADIVMFLFLVPQFLIAVKARPRSQYFHLGRQRVACDACHNGRARFLCLVAYPDQSKRFLAGKSAFVCIRDDRGNHQSCATPAFAVAPPVQTVTGRPAR